MSRWWWSRARTWGWLGAGLVVGWYGCGGGTDAPTFLERTAASEHAERAEVAVDYLRPAPSTGPEGGFGAMAAPGWVDAAVLFHGGSGYYASETGSPPGSYIGSSVHRMEDPEAGDWTWTSTSPSVALSSHVMVFAPPPTGSVYLYGGVTGGDEEWTADLSGSIYRYNASSPGWISVGAGAGVWGHAAAWDVDADRMLVFGGSTELTDPSQGTRSVLEAWSPGDSAPATLTEDVGPTARWRAAAVYDASASRFVVLGGIDGNGERLRDVWAFDGVAWVDLGTIAGVPSGAMIVGAAYDPEGERVLVLARDTGAGILVEGQWGGGGYAWSPIAPRGPLGFGVVPRLHGASLAWDVASDRLWIIGGRPEESMNGGDSVQNVAYRRDRLALGRESPPLILEPDEETVVQVRFDRHDEPEAGVTIRWSSQFLDEDPACDGETDADGVAQCPLRAPAEIPSEPLVARVTAEDTWGAVVNLDLQVEVVAPNGNGGTGNGETGNGETGNGETGNGETGNGETGNGESLAPGDDDPRTTIYGWGCSTGGAATLSAFLLLAFAALRMGAPRRGARIRRRARSAFRGGGLGLVLLLGLTAAPVRAETEPADGAQEAPLLRLAFLGLAPRAGIDPDLAGAVSSFAQTELIRLEAYDVMGLDEVQALLGLEAQRQLLGCAEQAAACLAEIGGALGTERAVIGDLSRIGASVVVNVAILDSQSARTLARTNRRVVAEDSVEPILDVLPELFVELVGRDPGARVAAPDLPSTRRVARSRADTERALRLSAGLRFDAELLGPGGAPGVFLSARHGRIAGALDVLSLPWVSRPPGGGAITAVRLEGRFHPVELAAGRISPYAGLGATAFGRALGLRVSGGVEAPIGRVLLAGSVAYERLVDGDLPYAPNAVLLAVAAGWTF